MSDEKKPTTPETTTETTKKSSVLLENLAVLTTPDGIQKYLLGTKKNGTPRAVYDIVRDYAKPGKKGKKKSKKKKKDHGTSYEFYLNTKKGKKKDKKNKKHWHI